MDMKAPVFIRALTRFVCCKWKPKMIIGDNFRTIKSIAVKRHLAIQEIKEKIEELVTGRNNCVQEV